MKEMTVKKKESKKEKKRMGSKANLPKIEITTQPQQNRKINNGVKIFRQGVKWPGINTLMLHQHQKVKDRKPKPQAKTSQKRLKERWDRPKEAEKNQKKRNGKTNQRKMKQNESKGKKPKRPPLSRVTLLHRPIKKGRVRMREGGVFE